MQDTRQPLAEVRETHPAGILVGYDGSANADMALRWAAREARARGTIVTICLARPCADPVIHRGGAVAAEPEVLREAKKVLASGSSVIADLAYVGGVRQMLVIAPAAAALCGQSPDAEMVVVGTRGDGRDVWPGLRVGSVSLKVAANAPGRVVVVRGSWQSVPGHVPRPVVVGTDGSPASESAVAFAFEEASLHHTNLVVICALADSAGVHGNAGHVRGDFEHLLARYELAYPDLPVQWQVSQGAARPALLAATSGAQLVVVGARGRGGFPDMPVGSVAQAVLSYARCTVGLVRSRAEVPAA